FPREFPDLAKEPLAYFSAEFGLHTSLPIYSGGLGILAGDHCKESSDLGIPLVGAGFVYPQGYFHQRIQSEGWQEDVYELLERKNAPIESACETPEERCLVELNEGHTSFMLLERARELVQEGLSFKEAAEQVRSTSIFTTHTPVPAGHDAFPLHMMEKHFAGYWDELKITKQEFMDLGRFGDSFNMTVLALRMTKWRNGVSHLHGRVTRRMWQVVWPELKEDQVPITSVTNGVHAPTWIA